jgi:hypothetical protein
MIQVFYFLMAFAAWLLCLVPPQLVAAQVPYASPLTYNHGEAVTAYRFGQEIFSLTLRLSSISSQVLLLLERGTMGTATGTFLKVIAKMSIIVHNAKWSHAILFSPPHSGIPNWIYAGYGKYHGYYSGRLRKMRNHFMPSRLRREMVPQTLFSLVVLRRIPWMVSNISANCSHSSHHSQVMSLKEWNRAVYISKELHTQLPQLQYLSNEQNYQNNHNDPLFYLRRFHFPSPLHSAHNYHFCYKIVASKL